jgi:hypothetical protein
MSVRARRSGAVICPASHGGACVKLLHFGAPRISVQRRGLVDRPRRSSHQHRSSLPTSDRSGRESSRRAAGPQDRRASFADLRDFPLARPDFLILESCRFAACHADALPERNWYAGHDLDGALAGSSRTWKTLGGSDYFSRFRTLNAAGNALPIPAGYGHLRFRRSLTRNSSGGVQSGL